MSQKRKRNMMKKRKIAVITGSRAEYGLLYWIIEAIGKDADLELQLVVTGMHLSSEFGLTVQEIERDGFPIAERVPMLLSSDSEEAVAASMGIGILGFSKVYARLKPDIILVLGDRFEIHSAVSAAVPFRLPVAHIHGGESTEGLIDELMRHSITKMSHLHFAATERYKRRIIQMGENPQNVFCVGSPALDNIVTLNLSSRPALCKELSIPQGKKIGIVSYHPVTLEDNTGKMQINELLAALQKRKDVFWLFTYANADTGGRIIVQMIKDVAQRHPHDAGLYASLGRERYLSLLKNADVMVGNSSSGLIEAPSFGLPVVNIGDRQKGREKAANVLDVVECKQGAILTAIDKALSAEFKKSLRGLKNPYAQEKTSQRIVEKLKTVSITEGLIKKSFFEL